METKAKRKMPHLSERERERMKNQVNSITLQFVRCVRMYFCHFIGRFSIIVVRCCVFFSLVHFCFSNSLLLFSPFHHKISCAFSGNSNFMYWWMLQHWFKIVFICRLLLALSFGNVFCFLSFFSPLSFHCLMACTMYITFLFRLIFISRQFIRRCVSACDFC